MPQEAAAGSLPATSLQALRHWEGVAACGGRRSGQGVSYVAITGVGKPVGNPLVSSGPVGVWLSRVRASAATLTRPRASSRPPATRLPPARSPGLARHVLGVGGASRPQGARRLRVWTRGPRMHADAPRFRLQCSWWSGSPVCLARESQVNFEAVVTTTASNSRFFSNEAHGCQ